MQLSCPECGNSVKSGRRYCGPGCRRRAALRGPNTYVPTPVQIAQRCEAIQQGWSEDDRRRRLKGHGAD